MTNSKVAIIGCGNLGLSLVHGLIEKDKTMASNIIATKRNIVQLKPLIEVGVQTTSDNKKAVRESNIIILSVKPYDTKSVIEEIRSELDPKRHILVSVATSITNKEICEWAQLELPIFRAMPNTAADVREAVTAICHINASENDINVITQLFNSIGITIFINEELMESATILGACGIAYVLRFIRAMTQGGIQVGFDSETAGRIVSQTVKGAAELLIKRKEHPESQIDKVTTPKGCTIVGLNEMEHSGFSSALIKGIVASYQKLEKS